MNNFFTTDSFEENYDKITEAEMVYNILERLKFGNDIENIPMSDPTHIVFPEGTRLVTALNHILAVSAPPSLTEYTNDMRAITIDIPTGYKFASSGFVMTNSSDRYTIVKAYTENARLDVTSIVKDPSYHGYDCTLEVEFDTPYPYDDKIVVYLRKNN